MTDIDCPDCPSKTTNLSWSPQSGICPFSHPSTLLLMTTLATLYPHHPVLQYLLLCTLDRMDWTGSPEWLSLPSSSASPLRSRPLVPIRPCGPVDDGIDESEARAAGARTSLDQTPAKLRSPPIPNPRRPHQRGLLEDGLLSEQPDLIQPTQSECWSLHSPRPPLASSSTKGGKKTLCKPGPNTPREVYPTGAQG